MKTKDKQKEYLAKIKGYKSLLEKSSQSLGSEIKEIQRRKSAVDTEIHSAKAEIYIVENDMNARDIDTTARGGRFQLFDDYVDYLKQQEKLKRWAEWNGTVYPMDAVLARRMLDTGVRAYHIDPTALPPDNYCIEEHRTKWRALTA